MEKRSLVRRPVLGALAFASIVSSLLAVSIARVPERTLGTAGGRILAPGWHFKPPFHAVRVVPLSGHLERIDVPIRSPEGAAIVARLSLDYRLDPPRLASHARNIDERGLEQVIADLAGGALRTIPVAPLLSSLTRAGGETSSLPDKGVEAIAGGLRAAGIEAARIEGRIGSATGLEAAAGRPQGGAAGAPVAAGQHSAPVAEATGIRLLMIGLDGPDWNTLDPPLPE